MAKKFFHANTYTAMHKISPACLSHIYLYPQPKYTCLLADIMHALLPSVQEHLQNIQVLFTLFPLGKYEHIPYV